MGIMYMNYFRGNQPTSAINTLSRTNTITGSDLVNKFNSLPRDTRASTRFVLNVIFINIGVYEWFIFSRLTMAGKRFGTLDRPGLTSLLLDDADGNLSAPEMPHLSGRGPRGINNDMVVVWHVWKCIMRMARLTLCTTLAEY
jgi:hypothetical protein